MTKPAQVFHPYQLHRDQLPLVRKHNLVCVGSPPKNFIELAPDKDMNGFVLEGNRFSSQEIGNYWGDTSSFI